jgi:hypothetical protein
VNSKAVADQQVAESQVSSSQIAQQRIGHDYGSPEVIDDPHHHEHDPHHHHDPGFWKKKVIWKEGWKKYWVSFDDHKFCLEILLKRDFFVTETRQKTNLETGRKENLEASVGCN